MAASLRRFRCCHRDAGMDTAGPRSRSRRGQGRGCRRPAAPRPECCSRRKSPPVRTTARTPRRSRVPTVPPAQLSSVKPPSAIDRTLLEHESRRRGSVDRLATCRKCAAAQRSPSEARPSEPTLAALCRQDYVSEVPNNPRMRTTTVRLPADLFRGLEAEADRRAAAVAARGSRCCACDREAGELPTTEGAAGWVFDHIDPATKPSELNRLWGRDPEHIAAEIAKCVLLCSSCHRAQHPSWKVLLAAAQQRANQRHAA